MRRNALKDGYINVDGWKFQAQDIVNITDYAFERQALNVVSLIDCTFERVSRIEHRVEIKLSYETRISPGYFIGQQKKCDFVQRLFLAQHALLGGRFELDKSFPKVVILTDKRSRHYVNVPTCTNSLQPGLRLQWNVIQ